MLHANSPTFSSKSFLNRTVLLWSEICEFLKVNIQFSLTALSIPPLIRVNRLLWSWSAHTCVYFTHIRFNPSRSTDGFEPLLRRCAAQVCSPPPSLVPFPIKISYRDVILRNVACLYARVHAIILPVWLHCGPLITAPEFLHSSSRMDRKGPLCRRNGFRRYVCEIMFLLISPVGTWRESTPLIFFLSSTSRNFRLL